MSKIQKVLDQEAQLKQAVAKLQEDYIKKMESVRKHYEHEIAELNKKLARRGELIHEEVEAKMKKLKPELEGDFQKKMEKLQKLDAGSLKSAKASLQDVYISLLT